jgi:hypothetical protein
MTVHHTATGRRHPNPGTTAALLAVTPGMLPRARIDAGGTRLRLRALQVMGHSSARIARCVGASDKTIRGLVSGNARTVSPRLRDAITEVYDTWWDKRPPERTRGERAAASAARRRAIAGNWCAGAALDDDLLDTPGYRPAHGWKPARGTGTATDLHPPARTRAAPAHSALRSRPPAGQRKDQAMKSQRQNDAGPPSGTRSPAYVVELWVSEQLRDRIQRPGQPLLGRRRPRPADERQGVMTEKPARRPSRGLPGRLATRMGEFQRRLSDRIFAGADVLAREHGWTITKGTGRFGFGARTYRDPRFDQRAAAARSSAPVRISPGIVPGPQALRKARTQP